MPKIKEDRWIGVLGIISVILLVPIGMTITGAKLWMVLVIVAAFLGLCVLAGWLMSGTQR